MPDRPDGVETDLDALHEQFARLENRCRDLEGVTIDIHDRKQAEIALRESE
jgi:hypothetical protein